MVHAAINCIFILIILASPIPGSAACSVAKMRDNLDLAAGHASTSHI